MSKLSSGSAAELPPANRSELADEEESSKSLSKAAKKKAARAKKQEAPLASAAQSLVIEQDPLASNYGDLGYPIHWPEVYNGLVWRELGYLTPGLKNQHVLLRGRLQTIRAIGNKMIFLVLRRGGLSVQCVLRVEPGVVSRQMAKYASRLTRESIVDVVGVISVPSDPVTGVTQQVEVQVQKLYCVSKAMPTLPITIEDAARSEADIGKAFQVGEQLVRVNQATRLDYRVLDLRAPAHNAIFQIQFRVGQIFREWLSEEKFVEIHTPRLIAGVSEGGAAVFKLDYRGQPACLAQSAQLHKQMAINGDLVRVFEVGPFFRAEGSFTHRHLCEFIGLHAEMEIDRSYLEVIGVVERLFDHLFQTLNRTYSDQLELVARQYPFQPLKYTTPILRLTFEEGVQLLKDAGVEVDPLGDLNTEAERKLGQLVLKKYDTEFYILHRYPLAVRPFYTMPCDDDQAYSNSFDVFIRGEEIISGGQRIHDPDSLAASAQARGIDVNTLSTFIDSFRYGAPPRGGFGAGLERVVMLFCGLKNIRLASLFPRDPKRLAP